MQTFVKLTLRLTTYVTTSPAWRCRSSSATRVSAWRSRPSARGRAMPSSTETSWPSRARTRIGRRSRETQSSEPSRLPAAPAFIGFLDETALVDQRLDARAQALVQGLGARRELRVDRETLRKDEALAFGRAPELGDQRPRFLGVDVVERERRDSAPIVETRREEAGIDQRREVRRRLDVHVWAQDEPRHRERPQEILERGLGRLPHRDPRLGAEVLDDDLLDVAVRFVEVADRDEGVDPLASRLADADEQTGRERDPELAGERDRAQAPRRHFVGRPIVREAAPEASPRHRLEDDPPAHVNL